jgi:hypothetical protein
MNIQIIKLISLVTMFFSWSPTQAQRQDQKFAQAMKQNSVSLREYTWKSRSEIRKEGDVKGTKLFMNRYAPDGTVVQIMLDETSAGIPQFGIRGAVAKRKKEEAQKLVAALQQLAKSYGELPPAKMQEFMTKATATLETNTPQPLLRLAARDVLQSGDEMVVWVDANTRRQRRIEINSSYEMKPVRIVTEFKDLPNGPTYMARSVLDYASEDLTLTVENFDYKRDAVSLNTKI